MLNEQGFGLDTQLTARILASGVRPYEVPVSYNSRTHEEGKKIEWRHGVESLAILWRERLHVRKGPNWHHSSRDVARRMRTDARTLLIAHERSRSTPPNSNLTIVVTDAKQVV
jgi:hypothetical protein